MASPGPQYLALPQLHDLEFSKDGNTAYATMFGAGQATAAGTALPFSTSATSSSAGPTRSTGSLGSITWDDGSLGAQHALPIIIAGKKYIVFADEAGGGVGVLRLTASQPTDSRA